MAELAPSAVAGDFRLGFAGDTFNTAWYLARCVPALDIAYCSAVGGDKISGDMRAFLRASGIDDTHVREVPARTIGMYLIALNDGERSFSYWRGQSAARLLAQDAEALAAAVMDAQMVFFSGITLAILDAAGRDTLFEVLRAARAAGKTIAFDPNLRPALWHSGTEMCETIMRAAGVSDLALPSFEDETGWFGDASPEATCARYMGAGVTTVIVKNGAAPVLYCDGAGQGSVPVTRAPSLIDTTAAGDSFNAGVLGGLMTGHALRASITTACALAREVVQARGALVPVTTTLAAPER